MPTPPLAAAKPRAIAPAAQAPHPPPLSRRADTTLTEQLALRFSEHIRQRLMPPGSRLPSVRECAKRHQVSTSTVVAAYDLLLAQGLVEARKQRGFFVRETRPAAAAGRPHAAARALEKAPDQAPALRPPVSATTLMRGMFQPPGSLPTLHPAPGRFGSTLPAGRRVTAVRPGSTVPRILMTRRDRP